MSAQRFQVLWTAQARKMLEGVSDRRIQDQLLKRSKQLESEPEKQGKPLLGELSAFRSLRAVGQRYRIIYKVERNRVIVLIVGVGIRKQGGSRDIYALARKLLRARLLG
ncbi:MAG TPA: type II toxin-antitoxin system RelE/ParE family toxin [Thermoanaerobaculia bacterium]|nr:type II toxin-antitoxin system RelE/ParE family toxin [Thermoanaerobaculia bacterium]